MDNWILDSGLPRQPLEEVLEPEMARQYRIARGEQCQFVPVIGRDRWLCSCGEENESGKPCACGLEAEALTRALLDELSKEAALRMEKEAAEREETEKTQAKESRRKKRKKRLLLAGSLVLILTLAVGIWHLCKFIFLPASHYSSAKEALKAQAWQEAYREFYLAGDYKDAAAQLQRFTVLPAREETLSKEQKKVSVYTYDDQGREIRSVHTSALPDGGGGFVTEAETVWVSVYDEAGRPLVQTDQTGRNEYTYNQQGHVATHDRYSHSGTASFSKTYIYEYDSLGRVVYRAEICSDYETVNYSYEVSSTYAYHENGQLAEQIVHANYPANPESGYITGSTWEYDADGNPVRQHTLNRSPVDPADYWEETDLWRYEEGRQVYHKQTRTYALDATRNSVEETTSTCDKKGRLLSEVTVATFPNMPSRNYREEQRFSYDENGNLLTEYRAQIFEDPQFQSLGGYEETGSRSYNRQGLLTGRRWTHTAADQVSGSNGLEMTCTYDYWGRITGQRTVRRAAGQSSTEVLSFYEDGQVKTRRTESNGAETTYTTEYIYFYQ